MLLLVPLLRGLIVGAGLFLAGQWLAARALGLRGLPHLRDARSGRLAPLWKRLAARGCGVAAAYLLSAGLAALGYSLMETPTARIQVAPGHGAQRAGMQDGDLVLAVDGVPVHSFDALRDQIQASRPAGTPLRLGVERRGVRLEVPVVPDGDGRIGVMRTGEVVPVRAGDALRQGLAVPVRALGGLVQMPGHLLSRALDPSAPIAVRAVGGPAPRAFFQRAGGSFWAWLLVSFGFEFALAWPLALLAAVALSVGEQRRRPPQPAPAL